MFATRQYAPRRIQRSSYARAVLAGRAVPHYVDAMVAQMACSVQKMRRKLALVHSSKAILYVLGMIKVNLHFILSFRVFCPIAYWRSAR